MLLAVYLSFFAGPCAVVGPACLPPLVYAECPPRAPGLVRPVAATHPDAFEEVHLICSLGLGSKTACANPIAHQRLPAYC